MLCKYLESREVGVHPFRVLQNYEIARRTLLLELSHSREIVPSHHGPVNSLDIDPSEHKYLLSGGSDSVVTCFSLEYGLNNKSRISYKPVFRISKNDHTYGISTVQWYPIDNGMFFTGSFDHSVRVWDSNSQQAILVFKMNGKVNSLHFSEQATTHSLIAVGTTDSKGRLCDIRSGTTSHSLIGHTEGIWTIKWNPSSEFLIATGSEDGTIRMWDIRKPGYLLAFDQHLSSSSPILSKHESIGITNSNTSSLSRQPVKKTLVGSAHVGAVTGLLFSRNGRYLVSCGTDGKIRCWDALIGKNTLINFPDNKNKKLTTSIQMSLSNNDLILYCPNQRNICAYNFRTGDLVQTYQGHFERVNACIFHPYSQELYSAASDNQILVWSPREDFVPQENKETMVLFVKFTCN